MNLLKLFRHPIWHYAVRKIFKLVEEDWADWTTDPVDRVRLSRLVDNKIECANELRVALNRARAAHARDVKMLLEKVEDLKAERNRVAIKERRYWIPVVNMLREQLNKEKATTRHICGAHLGTITSCPVCEMERQRT